MNGVHMGIMSKAVESWVAFSKDLDLTPKDKELFEKGTGLDIGIGVLV